MIKKLEVIKNSTSEYGKQTTKFSSTGCLKKTWKNIRTSQ